MQLFLLQFVVTVAAGTGGFVLALSGSASYRFLQPYTLAIIWASVACALASASLALSSEEPGPRLRLRSWAQLSVADTLVASGALGAIAVLSAPQRFLWPLVPLHVVVTTAAMAGPHWLLDGT
jgi:predicted dinucleotide-utilizing enzyme